MIGSNLGSRIAGLIGKRQVAAGVAFTLATTAMVVAAVASDGTPATNVNLDDGSVWVTNNQAQRVGRLVVRINELDLAVASGAGGDVVQDGRSVFFTGLSGGVSRLDVITGQPSGQNEIPLTGYQTRGGVGLILDSESGNLWVGSGGSIVAPEYPKKPDAIIAPGSLAIATVVDPENTDTFGNARGRVLIVEPSGWYELALDDAFEPVREPVEEGDEGTSTTEVKPDDAASDEPIEDPPPPPILTPQIQPIGVAFDEILDISSVGDNLVLLLTDGRVVAPGGEPVDVPGDSAVLQQPGPSADTALVASTAGLFLLDLEAGDLSRVASANAAPAAPVRVGPCVFGAWSGEIPTSFKSCSGVVLRNGEPIPNASPDVELVFRVNQRNVALNSPGNGGVWADHEGDLAYVGNWADVEEDTQDSEDKDDATGESLNFVERVCIEGGGAAPTAGDDELGVRPRQSIIDVLTNDDDINCEPIAITSVSPDGDTWGRLTIINNGQHLLYSPSDEMLSAASESIRAFTFQYVVEDTSGNKSSLATVTVTVKDRSRGNSAPELRPKSDGKTREMRAVVEEGRSISYDVLADWWDPDGDDLRLGDAISEGIGEASGTSDGVVRYAANGVPPGVERVAVTVTDGELSATESLEITVKPTGSALPPLTSTDFLTLVEGSTDTIYPLDNDSDPNENRLEMRPLWLPEPEGTFRTRMSGDGVEVTAIQAGTYLLEYDATDGVDATRGAIRLEVLAPTDDNRSPVAVPDTVQLRVDRVVNVDVLANDIDEDGDILAVTNVSASGNDESAGIVRASVVDRRLIQLEVVPGPTGETPTGPFWVSYTVSDGYAAQRAGQQDAIQNTSDALRAIGGISVTIQPSSVDQPPILTTDAAVVRSGDIVQVPVLRNDIDPDSDPIVLESVDADQATMLEQTNAGVVWTEGPFVYFQGGEPGRYSVLYNVSAAGRQATAEVSFEVTPLPNPETNANQAPSPSDLVLRAVRNTTVRLQVPLYGADADGDSVVLVDEFTDLQGSANGNSVSADPENPQFILFTAGANALATDSFTYSVEDRFGERGSGTVNVVVLDDEGWPPQAHDDVFSARPGRTLSIPLLANDSSPSDRPLEIAELSFFDLEGEATATPQNPSSVKLLDQSVADQRGRVEVVVPTDGSTLIEHYRISDGRNPSDAFLRVTPDPEAPNLPPVAGMDVVELTDVAGQEQVDVEVLLNDFDPDDATVEFQLDVPAGQDATVSRDVVTVPLTQRSRTVLYRITDADGASAIGIIRVPGVENHPPVLSEAGRDPGRRRIEAGSGLTLQIDLDDIVEDPDGDPDIRLTPREVRVLGNLGSVTRLDDGTGFTYKPPPDLRSQAPIGIQFEVTDRPNMSLEERQLPNCNCVTLLTVELIVEASSPPRILSQGAVSVPQLDEEVAYDLAPLVVDDQGDSLTFNLDPSSFGGLDVTQNGSVINLVSTQAGDAKIPIGTTIPIRFSVTDGNFDAVEGTVLVTMIATNKGQPAAGTLPVQEAERDFPYSIPNLISIAFNPFPDRPLTLVTSTVDGGTSLTCNEQGDCEFQSDTVGTFTAGYVLKDAVDQTANGSFNVVVKGKPRAPGIPSIESVGNYVVNLSWSAADMQGGAFVKYIVTATETGATKEFTNTGGQFDGLTNGDVYHFTVQAENELGLGEVSGLSSPAIPDRVPDPPVGAAIIDYQDSQLTLQWAPPPTAGDFTPIQQFEVSIGGQVLLVDGSTTTLVVGAGGAGGTLQNGTDYTFRVRAQNSATVNNGWGDWGTISGSERPSRYPDPPTNVVAVNSGDGGAPRLTVSWLAPAFDGGRAVASYDVCMNGGPCQTVSSGTVATFDAVRQQSASFTVIALNSDKNRNTSDPATSPAVIAVGIPDAPVINSVTSGNFQLVATATTTNNSGCSTVSIQYSIAVGSTWQPTGATWQSSGTFSGRVNGQPYTIVARAVLGTQCGTLGVTYESGPSASVTQTPYGPLVQPSMNVSRSGNVITWNWNANRAADGRSDWAALLGGECNKPPSDPGFSGNSTVGSYLRDYGYSSGDKTCTITIRAGGVPDKAASATAFTLAPPPPPTVGYSKGLLYTGGGCGGCYFVVLNGSNVPPNSPVTYRCGTGTGWTSTFTLTTTSANGSFNRTQSNCYHALGFPQDFEVFIAGTTYAFISRW